MSPNLGNLRNRLLDALELAGAGADGGALFDELVARYSEPHRHYHTLEHVAACLDALDELAVPCEHAGEVELALWFHDAIYDPRRNDNETCSAKLAQSWLLRLEVPATAVARVANAVNATSHHVASSSDDAVVSDVDLAVLGSSSVAYDCFERRIRKEFAHVPEPLFREARCRVLGEFLARPAIYRVPKICGILEQSARRNLERRIDELSCLLP